MDARACPETSFPKVPTNNVGTVRPHGSLVPASAKAVQEPSEIQGSFFNVTEQLFEWLTQKESFLKSFMVTGGNL